jgi:hypothetical protein
MDELMRKTVEIVRGNSRFLQPQKVQDVSRRCRSVRIRYNTFFSLPAVFNWYVL